MFFSQGTREALAGYCRTHKKVPESLERAGIAPRLAVATRHGDLVFVPSVDDQGRVTWQCEGGENIRAAVLSAACKR